METFTNTDKYDHVTLKVCQHSLDKFNKVLVCAHIMPFRPQLHVIKFHRTFSLVNT